MISIPCRPLRRRIHAGYHRRNPTGRYYPPCSLFAPEKRYGVDVDPVRRESSAGQIGSLGK